LIAGWDQLRAWLAEEREASERHGRIALAAARWSQRGRPRRLLLRGEELDDLLRWLPRHDLPLAAIEQQLVDASRADRLRGARWRRRALFAAAGLALAFIAALALGLQRYRAAMHEEKRAGIARAAAAHPD